MGGFDLLQRRGFGSDREKRMIDGAMQSAERAKTLVKRLLSFARRQPLHLRAVNLGRLIAGMGDLVSSTSGPRIKVKIKVAADLPTVMIDPNQLEMAILNLSVNARDAMRGGGTLTISAQCETVEGRHRTNLVAGQYIRLSVTEHWPDLSILIVSGYADVDEISGDMARLTKPFRQVDLAACVRELAVN